MSDDDWYERALRELDEEDETASDDTDTDADTDTDTASTSKAGSESEPIEIDHDTDTAAVENSQPTDGPDATHSETDSARVNTDRGAAVDANVDPIPFDELSESEPSDPFGGIQDNSTTETEPETETETTDPFGGSQRPSSQSPADDSDGFGFDSFDSDQPGSGGDAFGFGDFGAQQDTQTSAAGNTDTFDDSEFESDIDRIAIGIKGLDEMILGGVPQRSLMVVIGSAGTGKTTFGLQFLHHGLKQGEKAVFITLEQTREAILATAEERGWPFREYESEGYLAVVALDPVEMANSLSSLRGDISRLITEFEADRLVLDSVSLLEMMYDHPAKRRSEVFDFTRSLKEAGVTTMLTSEASEDNPYASRHGIVEYLTDAVFVLQYVRPSNFRETRLAVEIQKIRDANHSRETKPYEITADGISVYRQANIF